MSATAIDLGEIQNLGKAIGLLNSSDGFQDDWLTKPGDYLSSVLANQTQRDALVQFVDDILGGETRETDPDGLVWLPIATNTAPHVTVYAVLDPTPADFVGIGVGARLTTTSPQSKTSVHVPIFRAAKAGHSVADPILIGSSPTVMIRLDTEVTLGSAPPLGGIGLSLKVPTKAGGTPQFALSLKQLKLPGASQARDLNLSISDLASLESSALELVLGLARAAADAAGAAAPQLTALIGLLGLGGTGPIPALPVEALVSQGVHALSTWFESVISNPPARDAWLANLASLLNGTVSGGAIAFTLGPAQVSFGVNVRSGTGGHPVVTPTLAVEIAQGSTRARAEADLLDIDLGGGSARALPHLALFAQFGKRPGGGVSLLTGDPKVDDVRVGVTLDSDRRPNFLLAADGVVINGHTYPTLDLSSPDAIAEVAGTVLGNVVSDLLAQLGPIGTAIGMLVGVTAPPSAPGATLLNTATFLHDPLGAVRGYWQGLLHDHPVAVKDLLTILRDLLADASQAATAVSGTGAVADPWRMPIAGPVGLDVWSSSGGDVLDVAISAAFIADNLGQRCTRVESRIALGLLRLNLAAGGATFLTSVEGRLTAKARLLSKAVLNAGPLSLSADLIGLAVRWQPTAGVSVAILAPNLQASNGTFTVPVTLPVLAADGSFTVDANGWDLLEKLAGLLATATPVPWIGKLVEALGWLPDTSVSQPHLRLADLAATPADAIKNWLIALAIDDAGNIASALQSLARMITGSSDTSGLLHGRGIFEDPYRLPLLPIGKSPEAAVWLLPDGAAPEQLFSDEGLRSWRPGMPGLQPVDLAYGVALEASLSHEIDDLASGRPDLVAGFQLLVTRWTGSDGRIVPPVSDPAGITVHRVNGVPFDQLAASINLATTLGAAPATTIRITVIAAGAPLPAGKVIDLRAPGLAPESFPLPTASTGDWFVALGGRDAARLASGDPDGIAGQAARLTRVLAPFSALAGNVALVAQDAAGHAALAAANALAFVDAVVLLGTPLTPVAFEVLDDEPGGDALRLLRSLLPPLDPAETDDFDLVIGRSLVGGLADLLPLGDPGRELRPAAVPIVPRAGLPVHAFFGVLDESTVLRGMTAVAAAGLSSRVSALAAAARRPVTGVRCGLRIPVAPGSAGVTVSGNALLELFGADVVGGVPAVSTARILHLHVEIRRVNGWLVGGPGVGLGAGDRPKQELRWLECNLSVPLTAGAPSAEIVFHEAHVFDIFRERWVVRSDASGGALDVVTPTLPEVRVLIAAVAEQLSSAAAPEIAALTSLLRGLNILDPGNGSVPDAVDHLLNDPAAHIAAALSAQAAAISAAINQLLTGLPGITIDLNARRVVLDTGGSGMVDWTAHVEASAAGVFSAVATLGSAGTTAAGGALVRFESGPMRATLEWHRPSLATPQLIPLWPAPDAAALAKAFISLLPAELTRIGLEYLRSLDDTARPIIDAALDAVGLLGAPAGGNRSVLLPAGLLHDPLSWFLHESAFGAGGNFNAAKVVALVNALKPIIGISGNPGEWNLATGIKAIVDTNNGNLRLGLNLDTSALAPIAGAAGRAVAAGTFSLTIPSGSPPQPGVLLSVGIAGVPAGRSAVYVEIAPTLSVFIRPATGADLTLFPNPPGLGQLASTAVTHALPFILDQLAGLTDAGLQTQVAAVVRAIGDGLNLRSGAPPKFDPAKLQAWAADPVASLLAALPTLTSAALNAISTALAPVLPTGVTAAVAAGKLTVTASSLQVSWQPSPLQFTCSGTITAIPGIGRATIGIVLDSAGLNSVTAVAGPATIDAGGLILRPLLAVAVGQSPPGGRRVQVGLAFDDAGTNYVAARFNLAASSFALVSVNGTTESIDPAQVALSLLQQVLDLAASLAIKTTTITQLLANHVGSTTVKDVMRGVLLDAATATHLDANLFDPSLLLGRLQKLALNLAGATPQITVGGGLKIGLSKTAGNIVQVTLGVNGRIPLNSGDVVVSIEADSRWIQGQPAAGIAIGLLNASTMTFTPTLAANGIGVRISRSSGPLLDLGLSLGSVAVHLFGEVGGGTLSGGVQLQLSDLAVAPGSASGGNSVAKGVMGDGGTGQNQLRPAFSPALAVQKHSGGPVLVSLSAGDGNGPWFLVIQKGFGPIYIEQIGFGVTVLQSQLQKISLILDGRVSLFGLTAAVEDLQITFVIASDASLFDPSRWRIDLGGLAISADVGGVSLSGGLRRFGDPDSPSVEYIGMLLGRFAVYGLSVYGGYGSSVVGGERFSAFFAFGAIVGPIGGPPAFFLTGIGGGLGINRDLIFPTDLSKFGEFPFLKALDPGAKPSSDPMAEITRLRDFFPMKRGEFWFAAGISFNSFALVDGVAVIAIKIGDGFEFALLGLARMALPRPQFALVSIELGLIARFSSKEGVLWIQAQLTDNSWLLYEDVRLTGGFAFVTWYKGPNAGQFVLTIGGYHPSFHHDLYPIVPRLGFHWNVSDAIVIKGESYFALTSEAIMAGGKLTASAHFGPAWAEIVFGADGIVYFDPFRFEIEVYASISAGVTIDLFFGEVTISISLGAKLQLAGPKFHGVAEFDVGPITITVPFGDSSQSQKVYLPWDQFVRKYLEEASPGVARCLSAIPGKGALPPGTGPGGATDTATADGSADKPFEVLPEFEFSFTTTIPAQKVNIASAANDQSFPPSGVLGIAPVGISAANSRVVLTLKDKGNADQLAKLVFTASQGGAFPVGVWGPPQADDDRKVPAGDVITAVDGGLFQAQATLKNTLPTPIKYNQVFAPGPRKPLPFVNIQANRAAFLTAAADLSSILPAASGATATYKAATPWLKAGGHSNTAIAAMARERSAPPRLGTLTQDLATAETPTPAVKFPSPLTRPPIDFAVHPPRAIAVMTAPGLPERAPVRTTVKDTTIQRVAALSIRDVQAQLPSAVAAKLVRVAQPASKLATTVGATGAAPLTRVARGPVAAVAARGASLDSQARLAAISAVLGGASLQTQPSLATAAADPGAQQIRAGEIVVLQLPNAKRDANPAALRPSLIIKGNARLVAFSHGGSVLLDVPGSPNGTPVPMGTERIAVLALDDGAATHPGLLGWHSGQDVAYVGWSSAVVAGGIMRAEGAAAIRSTTQRFRAGWLNAAELVTGTNIVITRFTQFVPTVAVLIDDPINSDTERALTLGVEGADRVQGPDGKPLPPTIVVAGNRSILIYSLQAPPVSTVPLAHPVTISVASQTNWHVAGVLGGSDSPSAMADRMTRFDRDSVTRPLTTAHGGFVELSWLVPPVPTDKPKPTAKKAAAKQAAAKPPAAKPPAKKSAAKKPPRRKK